MTTNCAVEVGLSGSTGTGNFVGATSPTLITPTLGVATATSVTFGQSTLANYNDSTWTPVISFGGASVGITYSRQQGIFIQIGKVVYFAIDIILTSKGSSTGNAAISLPSTTRNVSNCQYVTSVLAQNLTFTGNFQGYIPSNSALLEFQSNVSGSTTVFLADTNFANNTEILTNGFYFV